MYYARGGRVAQFESAEAVFPSALHFSGEGDLFPVHIRYEDDDVDAFAKGGLAQETMAVKDAGRHGDTEIVHMNKEELEELKQMWGEPTINPQTGQPEYFLKKLWKGVKKVIKPIAPLLPIAAMFIPGIGPLASAAIGALSGGVTGGWKGALAGGLTGGLTGGANPIAGQAMKSIAPNLSARAASALGSAAVGAGTGALTGQNPLTSAAMAGGMNYLANPTAQINKGIPTTADTMKDLASVNSPAISGGATSMSLPSNVAFAGDQNLANLGLSEKSLAASAPYVSPSIVTRPVMPAVAPSPLAVNAAQVAPASGGGIGGWLKKESLIKGVPNYLPAGAAAVLAASALTKKKDPGLETADQFFGKDYGAGMGGASPTSMGTSVGTPRGVSSRPLASYYTGYRSPYFGQDMEGYAHGGDVAPGHGSRSFAVNGAGTGRSDDIPAMLSDGEYVIDAETVAMLGDGSSKAGAKKLDAFRVKIRKHKGRDLARGKFSAKAKVPEAYMMGGRA